jgi:hypothetical protein
MKKIIAAVFVAGISAFAADTATIKTTIAKFDTSFVKEIVKDSAKLTEYKTKATADSLRLTLEGKKDSGSWTANLPDSVKAKFEAKKADLDKKRDSLRTELSSKLDSVKVKVEALKTEAKTKRDAFVATLKDADKVVVAKKITEIEKKADARTAAIEKAIADVKAKLETKKAAK